jgi:Fe-S-cluster containining protein
MTEPNSSASATESRLPLLIPEGIRYNCQGCGRCCAGWAVGLTEADYVRVKDVDWGSLHPDLAGKELFTHRQQEYEQGLSLYPHHTKAREDGTCSFLINDLCFIHSTFGEATKPGMCKLFPYTFVPTPSGIFVGVVLNSMAAVRNMGELLSNQREYLEHTWRLVIEQEQAQGRASELVASVASSITQENVGAIKFDVNLVPGVALEWAEFLQIEARLLSALAVEETANIFQTFLTLSEILAEALRLKNTKQDLATLTLFKPSIDRWYLETPGFFENMVFNLLAFRNYQWPQMRKEYSATWAAANKSALTEPRVIKSAMKTVMQGKMDLVGIGSVNLNKAKNYKIDAFSAEIDGFFRRYLYLKFFSKTFCGPPLAGFSMIAGYNNIAANFLSAVTYAKAYALHRNEKAVRIADLYEAYFLMDKEMVSLSQLPKDRAQFYDTGFASPRLFSRLLGQYSLSVGG